MSNTEMRMICLDILQTFVDHGYKVKVNRWFASDKEADLISMSHDCISLDVAEVKLYKNLRWGCLALFTKHDESFDICTARRTSDLFKRSMFLNWSSYKVCNIAINANYKEVIGVNLK